MARPNLSVFLKGYLFVGTVLLLGAGVLYTTNQANRLKRQSETVATLFARFSALATLAALDNPEVKEIFEEVVKPADFPMILTDTQGRPYVWKLPDAKELDAIDITTISSIRDPKATPPEGPVRQLFAIRDRFAEQNEPVAIRRPGSGEPFGYVYYGEPSLVRQLRWLPFLQSAGLFLFVGLAYVGYRSIKTSEQRAIWIGLAKETAHQLGTPISSLLGWVELLRERQLEGTPNPEDVIVSSGDPPGGAGIGIPGTASDGLSGSSASGGALGALAVPSSGSPRKPSEMIQVDRAFFGEVLDEIENDAERLQKIANRFGQVGSMPKLEIADVAPVVSEAVRYFRRRIPHLGKNVEIRERYDLVPPASVNKELIEWVVENVLKNAVDATEGGGQGPIEVDVLYKKEMESVLVRITDHGRGMTAQEAKRVFSPGYTTKQRGWGLGLTLAQRIVEDYHGGKIWVEKSAPGRGTTITISFPT